MKNKLLLSDTVLENSDSVLFISRTTELFYNSSIY